MLNVKKIKAIREAVGLSQAKAAEKSGFSRQRWNDIEKGRKRNIELDTLSAIAKVLGLKAKDLLK